MSVADTDELLLPHDRSRTPTLYRYFDADGRLLYVGVTTGQLSRMISHAGASRWWRRAVSSTLVHYDTEDEMFVAERRAIAEERPLYNRAWNPDWNDPVVREHREAMAQIRRTEAEVRERLPRAWGALMRLVASGTSIE